MALLTDREMLTNETERLAALYATGLLDTEAEARFDRLVRLAANSFGVSTALVSLIDEERQWFKARHGLEACQTDRSISFCDHAIRRDDVMVVLDASKDPFFATNPLVEGDPRIRFYAGAPLITKEGYALGTLCLIDPEPREDFSAREQQMLQDFAAMVMREIESAHASERIADLEVINRELQHRMGNMYAHVSSLVSTLGRSESDKEEFVIRLREKISTLAQTQSLLASHEWKSAPLADLTRAALSSFLTDQEGERIEIKGDSDLRISARSAFTLSLMLNELGTNSLKHGVLRDDYGHVEFSWSTGEQIELVWREVRDKVDGAALGSGHDAPNHPGGDGFGTKLLHRIVPRTLKGEATSEFHPEGLVYRVTADPAMLTAPR